MCEIVSAMQPSIRATAYCTELTVGPLCDRIGGVCLASDDRARAVDDLEQGLRVQRLAKSLSIANRGW